MDIANLKEQVEIYIAKLQEITNKYWSDNNFTHSPAPRIEMTEGNRYLKILSNKYNFTGKSEGGSVHTFIDRTNGNILKAGTFKAPAANGVRGNIFSADFENCVNAHGAKYLR